MEIRNFDKTLNSKVKIRKTDYDNFEDNKTENNFSSQSNIAKIESKPEQKMQISDKNIDKTVSNDVNIHKNHRQRLKNQFLENGLSVLTDIQKLELLLFYAIPQKDTNPVAHELIKKFGSLKSIFSADYNKLMEVNGIKENSALLIKLLSSFYSAISIPNETTQITGVMEAINFCSKLYVGVDVEQFYVICLTKSNQIKKYKMIQSGSANEIVLQIRNITEFAISEKCNRIIVSHNHPEGKAIMSDDDFSFTYSLICSCLLNSIEVVDHIIVGTDTSISLAKKQVLQKIKETAFNALKISTQKQQLLSSYSMDYKLD